MLFKGEGIEQDYEAATAWIEQAANQGHILAQNRLARILARGYGAPPEPVKAAQYYLLSKQGGKKDDWLEDFFTQLPASGAGTSSTGRQPSDRVVNFNSHRDSNHPKQGPSEPTIRPFCGANPLKTLAKGR